VGPETSFCTICGASLKDIARQGSIQLSTKEKGGTLEDSVAGYFRRIGFDVKPRVRMRDRSDVSHELDVLASKKEALGTIRLAVECK
jgi:hypothetical protein